MSLSVHLYLLIQAHLLCASAYTYANGTQCVLWCTFDEDTQRDALSKLNKGDQFTFEGVCNSWGNWSDCEFVE